MTELSSDSPATPRPASSLETPSSVSGFRSRELDVLPYLMAAYALLSIVRLAEGSRRFEDLACVVIVPVLAWGVRRRWRWAERATLAALVVAGIGAVGLFVRERAAFASFGFAAMFCGYYAVVLARHTFRFGWSATPEGWLGAAALCGEQHSVAILRHETPEGDVWRSDGLRAATGIELVVFAPRNAVATASLDQELYPSLLRMFIDITDADPSSMVAGFSMQNGDPPEPIVDGADIVGARVVVPRRSRCALALSGLATHLQIQPLTAAELEQVPPLGWWQRVAASRARSAAPNA